MHGLKMLNEREDGFRFVFNYYRVLHINIFGFTGTSHKTAFKHILYKSSNNIRCHLDISSVAF